MEHDRGHHDRAFEMLYPLRYKMVGIGGSDAQVSSSAVAWLDPSPGPRLDAQSVKLAESESAVRKSSVRMYRVNNARAACAAAGRWETSGVGFTSGFVNCCLQRDVFSQLMVHAAMKSEKKRNQKLGRCVSVRVHARPHTHTPGFPDFNKPDSLLTRLAFLACRHGYHVHLLISRLTHPADAS